MGRYNDEDVNDLVGYIQQLESSLTKRDEIIAAKDHRIAALEAEVSIIEKSEAKHYGGSKNHFSQIEVGEEQDTPKEHIMHEHQKDATADTISSDPVSHSPNQVSDDSCDVESDGSFSHIEENVSRLHLSSSEDSMDVSDGRWNIPFDDLSDEELMAKTPPSDGILHRNALKEIGFKPVKDYRHFPDGSEGFGARDTTPVRPLAKRSHPIGHPGASPIVQAFRRGLLKDSRLDKENIDPLHRAPVRTSLSSGFTSPCR